MATLDVAAAGTGTLVGALTAVPALQDNALLTLEHVKAHLQITSAEQDAAVITYINGCSDAMETLTGRRLVSRTYTDEYLYVRAHRVLGIEWLDVESPITALISLSIEGTAQTLWMPGAPGTPQDADVFVLAGRDPKHGRDRIIRPAGWWDGMFVRRTYTAGYGGTGPDAVPIPGDLEQAVLTLATDWYYLQTRQAEPVISRSAGAETVTYVNEALPRRFPLLINAYRRWP
jgi:uncharacterized phiE125 gp8 family phage protein